jgi:hypothetical protein
VEDGVGHRHCLAKISSEREREREKNLYLEVDPAIAISPSHRQTHQGTEEYSRAGQPPLIRGQRPQDRPLFRLSVSGGQAAARRRLLGHPDAPALGGDGTYTGVDWGSKEETSNT